MSKTATCARCHKTIKSNAKIYKGKQYHPLCKEAVLDGR